MDLIEFFYGALYIKQNICSRPYHALIGHARMGTGSDDLLYFCLGYINVFLADKLIGNDRNLFLFRVLFDKNKNTVLYMLSICL